MSYSSAVWKSEHGWVLMSDLFLAGRGQPPHFNLYIQWEERVSKVSGILFYRSTNPILSVPPMWPYPNLINHLPKASYPNPTKLGLQYMNFGETWASVHNINMRKHTYIHICLHVLREIIHILATYSANDRLRNIISRIKYKNRSDDISFHSFFIYST